MHDPNHDLAPDHDLGPDLAPTLGADRSRFAELVGPQTPLVPEGGQRSTGTSGVDGVDRVCAERDGFRPALWEDVLGPIAAAAAVPVVDALIAEIGRLRALVGELTPFLLADVRAGLELCEPTGDHPADDCEDCCWFQSSLAWQARIVAGELGDVALLPHPGIGPVDPGDAHG